MRVRRNPLSSCGTILFFSLLILGILCLWWASAAEAQDPIERRLAWDRPTTRTDGTPLSIEEMANYAMCVREQSIPDIASGQEDDADNDGIFDTMEPCNLVVMIAGDAEETTVTYVPTTREGSIFFRILAIDTLGQASDYSNQVSFTFAFETAGPEHPNVLRFILTEPTP